MTQAPAPTAQLEQRHFTTVKYGGEEMNLDFGHLMTENHNAQPIKNKKGESVMPRVGVGTWCRITNRANHELAYAVAKVHPGKAESVIVDRQLNEAFVIKPQPADSFNRSTGRKVSLAKALNSLFPHDRDARGVFWAAYWAKIQEDHQAGIRRKQSAQEGSTNATEISAA